MSAIRDDFFVDASLRLRALGFSDRAVASVIISRFDQSCATQARLSRGVESAPASGRKALARMAGALMRPLAAANASLLVLTGASLSPVQLPSLRHLFGLAKG